VGSGDPPPWRHAACMRHDIADGKFTRGVATGRVCLLHELRL
jgi:hypothetical protein